MSGNPASSRGSQVRWAQPAADHTGSGDQVAEDDGSDGSEKSRRWGASNWGSFCGSIDPSDWDSNVGSTAGGNDFSEESDYESSDEADVGQEIVKLVDAYFVLAASCREDLVSKRVLTCLGFAPMNFRGRADVPLPMTKERVSKFMCKLVEGARELRQGAVLCAIGRRFGMTSAPGIGFLVKYVERKVSKDAILEAAAGVAAMGLFEELGEADLRASVARQAAKLVDLTARRMAEKATANAAVSEVLELRCLNRVKKSKVMGDAVLDNKDLDGKMFAVLMFQWPALEVQKWIAMYCLRNKIQAPESLVSPGQWKSIKILARAQQTGNPQELQTALLAACDARDTAEPPELLLHKIQGVAERLRSLFRLPENWHVEQLCKTFGQRVPFAKGAALVPVQPAMLNEFQLLMTKTFRSVATRDRKSPLPSGLTVRRVEEVQNVGYWTEFGKQVKKLSDGSEYGPSVPRDLKTTQYANALLQKIGLPVLGEGEALLLHGTSSHNANEIAKGRFDLEKCSGNGLGGKGLYFAECSSNSDEYTEQADPQGQHAVLVVRTFLGSVNHCADGNPDKAALPRSMKTGYDSVLLDRERVNGTYREFVIYDHRQCVPHFVLWYTRN